MAGMLAIDALAAEVGLNDEFARLREFGHQLAATFASIKANSGSLR